MGIFKNWFFNDSEKYIIKIEERLSNIEERLSNIEYFIQALYISETKEKEEKAEYIYDNPESSNNPWFIKEAVIDIFKNNNKSLSFRSEEHTSELQSRRDLVCRLLLEKKK